MLRLWFPIPDKDKSTFLQRYTFHKNISRSEKDSVKLNDGYAWMSIQEIQTKKSLDPEFVEMISLLTKSSEQQVGSFSAKGGFCLKVNFYLELSTMFEFSRQN